jgi:hypothetical protein
MKSTKKCVLLFSRYLCVESGVSQTHKQMPAVGTPMHQYREYQMGWTRRRSHTHSGIEVEGEVDDG